MDRTYDKQQMEHDKVKKKRKLNEDNQNQDDGWIVVKKKECPLTIEICDYNKVNRFYSHKSLQNYIRYILVQSIPNPMWLSIRRQSLIERIIYIDLQIQNNLFESLLSSKQLAFLSSISNEKNTATFRGASKIFRQDLWQALLSYQNDQNIQEIASNKSLQQLPQKLNQQLYEKYHKYVLTPEQLKTHLYPNKSMRLYDDYYEPKIQQNKTQQKNHILIVDCEMVSSSEGFQLARATIVNFQGEILFDELFKPSVQIINYNTQFSGITKELLDPVTNTLQNKLYPFLETLLCPQTIMVGHSLQNDLRAMKLIHNKVIDNSILYMRKNGTKFKLKNLADKILNRKIQSGQHDSIEDCLATLHLIRAKIENDCSIKKKEYNLLRQMSEMKKKAAIIDYAVDYEMKEFNANHYEKLEKYESIENTLKITKKYLRKDIDIPQLVLTRIQKPDGLQWEDYYQQFDNSFREFYAEIPKMSVVLVNCQVNPNIQIITKGGSLKPMSTNRNPCLILSV